MINIDKDILKLINDCEKECVEQFNEIERIEFLNQLKVLNAFNENHIQTHHFIGLVLYI